MKYSKLFVALGLALAGSASRADSHTYAPAEGLAFMVGPAVNIAQFPKNVTNVDNRPNLMGIATVEYFFTPMVGFRTGAHFLTRGYKPSNGADSIKANYLDIPFALTYAMGWPSGTARSEISLGGYYALNLGKQFEGGTFGFGPGFGDRTTKGFVGILLMHETVFQVSEELGLGYTVYGKLPLKPGRNNNGTDSSDKFYEAGVGFVVSWL